MVTKTKVVVCFFDPSTNEPTGVMIDSTSEIPLTLEKAEEMCKHVNPVNKISYRPAIITWEE